MADFDDGYAGYYANRLWQLLPGVYRAQDSVAPGVDGPLQELVNRIGAQVAVVRRSIDRVWADQSIETCDDWVIPYIGDLLDTNLLASLDAAGRRLDVAKTIHYRRRKGTIAILEEIARDVTGWNAHIVEAFRTLGRTRHSLDPPVGPDDGSGLLAYEGLVGRLTATPAGGLADLRSVHGAALTGTAFDEFAHTVDVRAGQGSLGHHGIGKLIVFVWRLLALPVSGATPVPVSGCPNMYTFDPTGRRVPLFMEPLAPEGDDFADTWTAALEWQVPGRLTESLQAAIASAQAAGVGPAATAARVEPEPPANPSRPSTAALTIPAGPTAVLPRPVTPVTPITPVTPVRPVTPITPVTPATTPEATTTAPPTTTTDTTSTTTTTTAPPPTTETTSTTAPPPTTETTSTTAPPPTTETTSTTTTTTTTTSTTTPAPTTPAPATTPVATTPAPLPTTAGPPTVPPPPSRAYPGAGAIPPFTAAAAGTPLEPVGIEIFPEVGQFRTASVPAAGLVVSYQYGFPATIGAGPYDRTLLGDPPQRFDPLTQVSGGSGLDTALSTAAGSGTIELSDSRTYAAVQNDTPPPAIVNLLIQAADLQRPVVRLPPPAAGAPRAAWAFTGATDPAVAEGRPSLVLDGLLFSGGDIVLRGAFASVRLTGFTADPGTAAPAGQSGFATAVDGASLAPATIWIEADPSAPAGSPNAIATLAIDNCVLGPIRTRNGGAVEAITITDSIVQGIAASGAGPALSDANIYDPQLLAGVLGSTWPPAHEVFELLPAGAQSAVRSAGSGPPGSSALEAIIAGLNGLITGASRLDASAPALTSVPLDPELAAMIAPGSTPDAAAVNRALLQAAFPVALSPAALACGTGSVSLTRVTVIGASFVHRLNANDAILTGFTVAQDGQDGCVRYCALPAGSYTPRQFNCAQTSPGAALFTSSCFGEPGYAQLLETVDRAIATASPGVTISAGAETGSEMGAYGNCLAPIKEGGLLVKCDEYMPLGLAPVIVHVT